MIPLEGEENKELTLVLLDAGRMVTLEPYSWAASNVGIEYAVESVIPAGEGRAFIPWTSIARAWTRAGHA
jgi:hypothetical protein